MASLSSQRVAEERSRCGPTCAGFFGATAKQAAEQTAHPGHPRVHLCGKLLVHLRPVAQVAAWRVRFSRPDGKHREKLNPWMVEKLRNVNQARSRLYRSQILQINTRWKALAEIYTMHSFAPSFAPFWNRIPKNEENHGGKRTWSNPGKTLLRTVLVAQIFR